jgi:hypothetical protein
LLGDQSIIPDRFGEELDVGNEVKDSEWYSFLNRFSPGKSSVLVADRNMDGKKKEEEKRDARL